MRNTNATPESPAHGAPGRAHPLFQQAVQAAQQSRYPADVLLLVADALDELARELGATPGRLPPATTLCMGEAYRATALAVLLRNTVPDVARHEPGGQRGILRRHLAALATEAPPACTWADLYTALGAVAAEVRAECGPTPSWWVYSRTEAKCIDAGHLVAQPSAVASLLDSHPAESRTALESAARALGALPEPAHHQALALLRAAAELLA